MRYYVRDVRIEASAKSGFASALPVHQARAVRRPGLLRRCCGL